MEDYSEYLKLINNCDPDSPLLSSTPLGARLSQLPLDYDCEKSLINLTQALNLKQLILTESGYFRDYRGLAEVMGFSEAKLETIIKLSSNSTLSLIRAYRNDKLSSNSQMTVNDLLKMIEKIERFDVIDDTLHILVKLANQKNQQPMQLAILNNNESQVNHVVESHYLGVNRLTIDDSAQFYIKYDAYVCFAPEDGSHAQNLLDLLHDNGFKAVTADDLLPGQFEQDALMQLILRCRKVIIIITPNFSHSEECKFQTKFVSEIGIKDGNPWIIPVLFEACDDSVLPSMIKVLSKIDFTDPNLKEWQRRKLLKTLSPPICYQAQRHHEMAPFDGRRYDCKPTGTVDQQISAQLLELPALTSSSSTKFNTDEPIVELPHSQDLNSSEIVGCLEQSQRRIHPTVSVNSNNFIDRIKRVFRNGSSSSQSTESSSSQAPLISTNSPSWSLSEDNFRTSK